MSSAVISPAQPEQILKGLSKLWTSLGEEEKQHGKPTVLRACAMTLIVATDEPDCGFFASQTISELMREHPSRGIVLSVSPEASHDFEARVLAQCWKPFGKAQQICCEQIELKARPENWANIGPVLVGLTAADLPIILWVRHQAACSPSAEQEGKKGLQAVMNLATKVIVDTKDLETSSALALIKEWRDQDRIIADLEWTRLTPWREPVAHIFDNTGRSNSFSTFDAIEVAHTGEKPGVAALYIAGWLSAPHHARVSFKKVEGYGPGLHSITMRSEQETITFERTGPDSMTLSSTNGRSRRYGYTEPNVTTLMTEELSVLGSDTAFNNAFSRAQGLLS